MKVLLIIPAFNEEANIAKVAAAVRNFAAEQTQFSLSYVVINDGSTDGTAEICRKHRIPTIHLPQNLGIGGAVQTGYLFAVRQNFDVAVQFDGDGQHDIHSLPDLIAPILAGECDFTIGSRFLADSTSFRSTAMRRFGIRFLSFVIRLCTGRQIYDVTSGYRAAGRRAICFLAENYPADYPEPESLVALLRNGFSLREIAATMHMRVGGVSSIRSWKSLYYMLKVTLSVLCTSFQKKSIK